MNRFCFNRFLRAVCLIFVLCCAGPRPALSSIRFSLPMGDNVRKAAVIVVADAAPENAKEDSTDPQGHRRPYTTLTVREVLKGDAKLAGEQIPVPRLHSLLGLHVPREAKGIAVLLREDWTASDLPLLEVYQQSEQIAALRVFVEIYNLPTERAHLLALRERIGSGNPLFAQQLFNDLARMRVPENFEILTGLFEKGDEATQRKVIDLIGRIGDKRGVPTLLAALDSPHRWVALEAATKLHFYFPGAPGVTDAFRRVLDSQYLQSSAESYLMNYDTALAAQIEARRNSYQKASVLLQRGDEAAARPLFELILQDPAQAELIIRFNAAWVMRSIQERPDQEESISRALLPILARYARNGDYLQAASAARVLSVLRHPESVALLLAILDKADQFLFEESTRIAAFALADRGEAYRQQVVERLQTRKDWAALRPLFEASDGKGQGSDNGQRLDQKLAFDEVTALTARLGERGSAGDADTSLRWIIYRLGALRDQRAIEPLFHDLTARPWSSRPTTTQALLQIGGEEVAQRATTLLQHSNEHWVREQAATIVFTLQGERALPLARRMVTEKDFGLKSIGIILLGHYGTPGDLELLLPLSDFWMGDRENHYWVMSAIAQIRSRHNYDLNGPIQKH